MNPPVRLLCLCAVLLFLVSCRSTYAEEPVAAAACGHTDPNTQAHTSDRLHDILNSMHKATQQLNSAQCEISYLTIQDPGLLDSRVLRTGTLYYLKEEKRSYLRVQFKDLKQDDFEPQARRDEYLFDGVWLTRIDYQLKQIDMFQQAEEDKPADVFELLRHNFPLVGFADVTTLNKDFDISLAQTPQDPNDTIHLFLKTKEQSPLSKDYTNLDFWINKDSYLPQRIQAYAVQGDIHDIRFSGLETNKKLEKAVFTIEKPSGFRENIEPLKPSGK